MKKTSLEQPNIKTRGLTTGQEWYGILVDDCKNIIVESSFASRWALVEGYWLLGQRLRQDKKFDTKLLQGLAVDIGISERTAWYALQTFDKYPDIQQLPEGKAISWNKLITKYLPQKPRKELVAPELPNGQYSVIYADPPWDIGSMVLEKWDSPLDDKYPTMSLDDLKALRVQELSADDSVCFMWVTLTTLPDGLELLESWGFKYHICLTWDKGNGWSNVGFHRKTELCLVGYKGRITQVIKQEGEYIPTLITEPKTAHSQKPIRMYELIETRTIGPKLELFARTTRPTWESWGNQLDGNNTRRH